MKNLSVIGDDPKELAKAITKAGAEVRPAGLQFNGPSTLKDLGQLWTTCLWRAANTQAFYSWLMFAIGDLLNHGEAHHGDSIYQIVDPDDWRESKLADAKWVAKKIPISMRQAPDVLSWAKHRDCASIKSVTARRKLIKEAAKHQYSYEEIRKRRKELAGQANGKRGRPSFPDLEVRRAGLDAHVFTQDNEMVACIYRKVGKLSKERIAVMLVEAISNAGK